MNDPEQNATFYANPHNMGEIVWDDELKLYIRKSSTDRRVSVQMHQYNPLPIRSGDIVLDCGGNIGAFASYALWNNASSVISFEPEPGNFDMLKRNHAWFKGQLVGAPAIPSRFEGKSWDIIQAALVGPSDPEVLNLHINRGPNQGCHSLSPIDFENGTTVPVKTIQFAEAMAKYRPTVVKVDIEGAEYSTLLFGGELHSASGKSISNGDSSNGTDGVHDHRFPQSAYAPYVFPKSVKALAIEFHYNHRTAWREEYAPALIEELGNQGFGMLVEPVIKKTSWYSLGVFVR